MPTYERPRPQPTWVSQPFWDACNEHRLIVQTCDACGAHIFIPQTFCSTCFGDRLSWTDATGRGHVLSYTVAWRPPTPAFEPPYVIAIVALDDGYEMMTNIVGVPADDVHIGMRVEVVFVSIAPGVNLPCFRPAGTGQQR